MKKTKLDLAELRVETFETRAGSEERGTVIGRGYTTDGPFLCDQGCVSGRDCEPTAEYSCLCMSDVWACISEGGGSC